MTHPYYEQLRARYNDTFPLLVRLILGGWVEDRIRSDLAHFPPFYPQFSMLADQFRCDVIARLERKIVTIDKMDIPAWRKSAFSRSLRAFIGNNAHNNPIPLYTRARIVLRSELRVLDICRSGHYIRACQTRGQADVASAAERLERFNFS